MENSSVNAEEAQIEVEAAEVEGGKEGKKGGKAGTGGKKQKQPAPEWRGCAESSKEGRKRRTEQDSRNGCHR